MQVRPSEPLPTRSRRRIATARGDSSGGDGTESDVFWDVSPAAFRVVWATLITLNVLIATYVLALGVAYVGLTHVRAVAYYFGMFRLISLDAFPLTTAGYGAAAIVYFARAAQFVFYSLRHRQLMFPAGAPSSQAAPAQSAASCNERVHSCRKPEGESRPSALHRGLQWLYGMYGVCSVRGVFFETIVMTREVIEVAIQTWQAYVCSKQSTKVWVNAAFAALIVVNCYSSPLLRRVLKPDAPSEAGRYRVTVLCVDLALDLVWFVAIPVLLWAPYFRELLRAGLVLYHDTFIIQGVMELSAMVPTSTFDVVLKLWPAVSTYFGMKKIELLTRRRAGRALGTDKNQSLPPSVPSISLARAAAASPRDALTRARIETWLRYLLLCWGTIVAAVYSYANFVNTPECSGGCQLVLRPWFQTSPVCECAALRIDCSRLRIDGSAREIELELRTTHSKGLMGLVIAHCPALHVPDAINTLRDLYGLTIFNCSIVAWDAGAEISSALHPNMGRVQLIHTFISDIPQALLHGDLPPRLLEINIVASNLTRLPSDLYLYWPHVTTLLLDHAEFTEYPMALGRMPSLETISLFGNRIAHIPDDAMQGNRNLRFLHVSQSPVASLPSSLAACELLVDVLATQTRVEDVDTPLANGTASMLANLRVFGFESPVCATRSSSASWLICQDRVFLYNGVESHAYYPLEAKLAEYPAV